MFYYDIYQGLLRLAWFAPVNAIKSLSPVYTVPFIAGRGPMWYSGWIGRHRAKNAWSGKFIGVASTYRRCYNDNLTIFVTEDTRCYQVLVIRPDVVSIQARLWADFRPN